MKISNRSLVRARGQVAQAAASACTTAAEPPPPLLLLLCIDNVMIKN